MHLIFYNRIFIILSLLVFLNLVFNGCYSQREISLDSGKATRIYKIEMLDGKEVDFKDNEVGYAFLLNNKIISKEKNGEENIYQVSEVKKMYTEKFDYVKTIFVVVGSAAVLFITALAILYRGMNGGLTGG